MPLTRAQQKVADEALRAASIEERVLTREAEYSSSAAPAAPPLPPGRLRAVTRSTNKKRPAQQPASQTSKKTRTSAAPTRSYNLRSKLQPEEPQQKTTVTPGTATRQINFFNGSSPAAADNDDDTREQATDLPPGVVNIFAKKPCCSHKQNKGICHCVPAGQDEIIKVLSSQHLTEYGLEYCREMKDREETQVAAILKRTTTTGSSEDALDNASNRSSDQDHSETEDDYSDDDDEEPVRARRTLALAARARRTPSPASSIVETAPLPRQPLLSARMRKVLVHWLSEVVVEFRLGDATYHLAVSLVDQLLSMGPTEAEWKAFEDDESGYVTDDEEDQPWFLIRRTDFQAVGWYVLASQLFLVPLIQSIFEYLICSLYFLPISNLVSVPVSG